MSLSQNIKAFVLTLLAMLTMLPTSAVAANTSNMYSNSDFIETEQPELSAETKTLISLYQKNLTPMAMKWLTMQNGVNDRIN